MSYVHSSYRIAIHSILQTTMLAWCGAGMVAAGVMSPLDRVKRIHYHHRQQQHHQ